MNEGIKSILAVSLVTLVLVGSIWGLFLFSRCDRETSSKVVPRRRLMIRHVEIKYRHIFNPSATTERVTQKEQ